MRKDVESRNIPAYCVSAADASCADPSVVIIIIVITVIIFAAVAAAERTVSRQRRTLPAVPPAQSPHILRTGAPVRAPANELHRNSIAE